MPVAPEAGIVPRATDAPQPRAAQGGPEAHPAGDASGRRFAASDASPEAGSIAHGEPPPVPAQSTQHGAKPPARGCVVSWQGPLLVGAEEGLAVSMGGRLYVLAQSAGGTQLSLHAGTLGHLLPVATRASSSSARALAFGPDGQGALVAAWIDAAGTLHAGRAGDAGFTDVVRVAEHVDGRFAPALSGTQPVLLAYTATVGETMHSFVSMQTAHGFGAPADITPAGHGAAAPSFVQGSGKPALIVIDARAGVSPLLEIPLDAALRPLPVLVRTPVSQPAAPPLLRAVALSPGDVVVAYAAIGKLAASAVGRVSLTRSDAPSALVPSFGYGALRFDACSTKGGALFALEVPEAIEATASRRLELVRVDRTGEGPRLLVAKEASRPHLTHLSDTEILLTYHVNDGIAGARVRCAP